jgi:hypothetical protein
MDVGAQPWFPIVHLRDGVGLALGEQRNLGLRIRAYGLGIAPRLLVEPEKVRRADAANCPGREELVKSCEEAATR